MGSRATGLRDKPRTIKLAACSVGLVVLVGLGAWLFASSHAAGPATNTEAENGTLSSCVSSVNDTSASGGKAVKFGGCASGPTSLDASGDTIPDTDYTAAGCNVVTSSSCPNTIFMATTGSDSNPGTKAAPVQTINQAVSLVPEGGTIVMRAGTYRDWYHNSGNTAAAIVTKGFTLQPYPHEKVWFDGTDSIPTSNWTSDGSGHWYMSWSTPQFCQGGYYDFPYNNQAKAPSNLTGASGKTYSDNQGPCSHWDQYGNTESNYPAAGDPQMVFIDGQQMNEVDQLSLATGGKFYYDWANRKIYISTNPSGHTVELATRPDALILGTSNTGYTVRGIGFKRYASNEYSNTTDAALYIGGTNPATIENDVFTLNAGIGLSVNTAGSVVNSSVFAFNGFNGAGYYGHDHTTKQTDNFLLENSVFNNNNTEHFGLNCSISCAAAGIKMAAVIGYTLKNNIFENGVDGSVGAWCDTDCSSGVFVDNLVKNNNVGYHYEQDDGGIIASNMFINNATGINVGATNTKIYNNTVVNSSLIAYRIYDDNRPLVVAHISMGNNIAYGTSVNVDYFAGGNVANESTPDTWFDYLDYNSYWRPTNFVLYRMIGASDTHYNSSSSFNTAYPSWAAHDQDYVGGSDPFFVNSAGGDYHVRSGSTAYNSGTNLPADVAAAVGVTTAVGQSRGALIWPGS